MVLVRFLGYLRLELGLKEITLELQEGSNVADAMVALSRRLDPEAPQAILPSRGGGYGVLFSRNCHLADASATLSEGDELVLFPPSSGGASRDWYVSSDGKGHAEWRGDMVPSEAGGLRPVQVSLSGPHEIPCKPVDAEAELERG